MGKKLRVVNIGISSFYDALTVQDCEAVQIDWQPPVKISEEMNHLLELTMNEVMTRNPVSIKADALAVEVLKILEQRRIDDIVVTDPNGIVQGFIDVQDLPGLKIM